MTTTAAPTRPIGHQTFQSIEYPGPINPSSSSSLDAALSTLGTGPDDRDAVFNKTQSHLEWRWRKDDHWAHPVLGERVPTHRLVVKVTRRRRRTRQSVENDVDQQDGGGVYHVQIPGMVKQTVRFRAMADYQYKPRSDSRIVQLIDGLAQGDYKTLSSFTFDSLDERYTEPTASTPSQDTFDWDHDITHRSLIASLPPPVFSTQAIPASRFTYEHGPNSKLEPYTNPVTGEETYRFVNKHKNIVYNFVQVHHATENVPTHPAPDVQAALASVNQKILEVVREKFEQRPMWSRLAIMNQFDAETRRMFQAKHAYLPAVAYTILDGPFRDNLVRLGYDPRTDRSVHVYQRLYFRNIREDGGARTTVRTAAAATSTSSVTSLHTATAPRSSSWQTDRLKHLHGTDFEPDINKSHLFDGQVLHRDIANYQLCDVTDPLLARLIRDPRALGDTLDDYTGWYKPTQYYAIKSILRLKWQALIDGKPAPLDKVAELVAQFCRGDDGTDQGGDDDWEALVELEERTAAAAAANTSTNATTASTTTTTATYRGPLSDAVQREQRLQAHVERRP